MVGLNVVNSNYCYAADVLILPEESVSKQSKYYGVLVC